MSSLIPGWQLTTVGDIAVELKSGLSRKLSSTDIGIPVIRSNNLISGGPVDFKDLKYWYLSDPRGAKVENYVLKNDDLLVNFINSSSVIGKCSIFASSLGRSVIYTTNIARLRVDQNCVLPRYFLILTQTEAYEQYIQAIAKPAVNQASFTMPDFKRWRFLLPPLPEQHKIVKILGTWDAAISLGGQLIAALQLRKKGLMQRLLTGQVRFPEFAGTEWVERSMGELLQETRRTVHIQSHCEYSLASVRRRSEGLFLRERKLGLEIVAPQMFQVRSGDFLISKRQIIHGASALVTPEFDGFLVSDSYHALVTKGDLDIDFFSWLAKTPFMYHIAAVSSHGVHIEKLFFVLDKYLTHKIRIPSSLSEQNRIAAILIAVDQDITLRRQQLDLLRQQRMGLMQQLVSGHVRVKQEEADIV